MATALNQSVADWAFKQLYGGRIDPKALVRKKPLMQWARHEKNFVNKDMKIPCPYVNPQGIGPTNADAVTAAAASEGVQFTLPQRHHYGYGRLEGEVVRNTLEGGDTSQFVNVLDKEVKGATESLGVEIHQRMYGARTGIRSFLSSTGAINTTTWFLAKPEDAQFYEINMQLVLVDPATGNIRVGTAVTVTKVDAVNGQLTCSANPNTFTSAAAGDGIARSKFATASGGVDLDGLSGWAPSGTISGSDSFLGVNRSVYPTRLAGVYVDCRQDNIRGGFIKAKARAEAQVGSNLYDSDSPFFINPKNLAQITQSIEQSKIVKLDLDDKYGIGLKAVEVMGHKFIRDAMCPVDTTFMVGPNAWARLTCGDQPRMEDQGGQKFFFDFDTGLLKFSLVHDGNTGAYEPYNITRVDLPTAPL